MTAPQSHVEKLMAAADQITARTLAIEEIRDLHERRMWTATGQFYCNYCLETGQRVWPCETVAILERHKLL